MRRTSPLERPSLRLNACPTAPPPTSCPRTLGNNVRTVDRPSSARHTGEIVRTAEQRVGSPPRWEAGRLIPILRVTAHWKRPSPAQGSTCGA